MEGISLGFTPGPLHQRSLGSLQGSTSNILSEGHNFSRTPKLPGRRPLRDLDPRRIAKKLDPRNLPGADLGKKIAKKAGKAGIDVAKKVGKTGINVAKKAGKAGIGAAKKGFDVAKKVFDPFGLFGGGDKYRKEPQGTRARINQRAASGPSGEGGFQRREVRRAFKRGTRDVQSARRLGREAIQFTRTSDLSSPARKARVKELKQGRHADVRQAQRGRTRAIAAARASRRTKGFSMPGKQVR